MSLSDAFYVATTQGERPPAGASSRCQADRKKRRPEVYLPQLLLACLFCAMAALTWRKWADPVVDFGRELYVPWQLSLGKVLYRDLAHISGPASQYFNAALFSVFGASYRTLIWANLFLTALETLLICRLFSNATSRLTGVLCSSTFLLLFAFAQFEGISNYNFISPYSHEATHGIIVSTIMITALSRAAGARSKLPTAIAGVCLGIVFLMKHDIFASAALVALVWATLGSLWFEQQKRGEFPPFAGACKQVLANLSHVVAFAVPVIVTVWIAFALTLGPTGAVAALASYWTPVFRRRITSNSFYLHSMGLDSPGHSLIIVLLSCGFVVLLVCFLFKTARMGAHMSKSGRRAAGLAVLAGGPVFAALLIPNWAFGGLLLVGIALLLADSLHSLREANRCLPQAAGRHRAIVLWSVFALGLLPRMLLYPRFSHYGFYLGMPATLAFVAAVTYALPRRFGADLGDRRLLRLVFATFVVAFGLRMTILTEARIYSLKTLQIGGGGDLMRVFPPATDPRGVEVKALLEVIDRSIPPDATIGVLPEGVILNYLSRRANPTPYFTFMVPEMEAAGESKVLASFRRTPPEYIVVLHRDTREYGVGLFGTDPRYGQQIMTWVRREYTPIYQSGSKPLVAVEAFGAEILKHW